MSQVATFAVRVKAIPGFTKEVNLAAQRGLNTLKKAIEGSGLNTDGMDAQIGSGDPIPEDKWGDTVVKPDDTVYLIEAIGGGGR